MSGADRQAISKGKVQAAKKRRVGSDPKDTIMLGQRIGQRERRIEQNIARQRIGAIGRLNLDKRRLTIIAPRHCAQKRHGRKASLSG